MIMFTSLFLPAHFVITYHIDHYPPLINPYHKIINKKTHYPSISILTFSHLKSHFLTLPFLFFSIVENLLPSFNLEAVYQPLLSPTYNHIFYTHTSFLVHHSFHLVVIHKVVIMSGMFFFNFIFYFSVLKSIYWAYFTLLFFGFLHLFISFKLSSKNALFVFAQFILNVLLTIKKVFYIIRTRFFTNKSKICSCPKHKKLYSKFLIKLFINVLPKLPIFNLSIFQPGHFKWSAKHVNNRHQPYIRGRTKLNFETLIYLLTKHRVSTFSYLCFGGFSYNVILNTCSQHAAYNVVSVNDIFISLFCIVFYIVLVTFIGYYLNFLHHYMNVLNTQYFLNICFIINQVYHIFSLVAYLIMKIILACKDKLINLYARKIGFVLIFPLSTIVVTKNEFTFLFSLLIFLELDNYYPHTVIKTSFIFLFFPIILSHSILKDLSYINEYSYRASYLVFYNFPMFTLKMKIISPLPFLHKLVYLLGSFSHFCITFYLKIGFIGHND